MIGEGLLPDSSGNVFWQPSSVIDANDRFPIEVLIFKDTATDLKASGLFQVRSTYTGASASIVVDYDCVPTTGKVKWQLTYKAIAVGESVDPSTDDESLTDNPTVPGTTLLMARSTFTLTPGNLVALDDVHWSLTRVGSDGANDTLAASVRVRAVRFLGA